MYDFLNLPELTDKYLRSLFLVFSLVLLFFSADCWLLTKHTGTFKKDIKLIDFLISRLRLLIPLVFVMFCIFLGIHGTFEKAFFYGAIFTSFAFYLSVFTFKYFKSRSLLWWLSLFLETSVFITFMDKYPIGAPIGLIVFSIMTALIVSAIEKSDTDKCEEEK